MFGPKPYKLFLLFITMIVFSREASAQNVSSPYSILGIGDITNRNYARYFPEAGTDLARRDLDSYNEDNPASLSALKYKLMHFEVSGSGRLSSFREPGA